MLTMTIVVGAIALPNPHLPRDDEHNVGLVPVEATSSSSDAVVTAHITNSKTVWYSGSDSAPEATDAVVTAHVTNSETVWYTGSDSSTETTQEKTSTTTSEKPAATNAEICDGRMNKETWKKHKLDNMMNFL